MSGRDTGCWEVDVSSALVCDSDAAARFEASASDGNGAVVCPVGRNSVGGLPKPASVAATVAGFEEICWVFRA